MIKDVKLNHLKNSLNLNNPQFKYARQIGNCSI